MQALSDEQRVDILEKKMDEGFARIDRSLTEMREDSRETREQIASWSRSILAMWLTMILGLAALLLQQHLLIVDL